MIGCYRFNLIKLSSMVFTLLLMGPVLIPGATAEALGGLLLKSGSTTSTTFSAYNVDRTINAGSTSPQFDANGVLLYPGSPVYPTLVSPPFVQQTPTSRTTTADNQNFTLIANSGSRGGISPFGSGRESTTLSSNIPTLGTQVGNSGVSFNPGSFASSNASSSATVAVVSVATATAIFNVVNGVLPSLSPGVFLDVAGYVNGGPGSFVAVGLSGSIGITQPGNDSQFLPFQLVGAYAGPGTQIVPINGDFNSTSPPPGFQFEATGNVLFSTTSGTFSSLTNLPVGTVISVQSTLTLIADPNSLIQLFPGPFPGSNLTVPDFGVFAGGPVGDLNLPSVPEPATWLSILISVPIVRLLSFHQRRGR